MQELLYEFFDKTERVAAEKERVEAASDKIEEANYDAALAWADEEEKKEQEALAAQKAKASASAGPVPVSQDPRQDPDNIAWMQEQMRLAKATYGDSFGEDIVEDF